MAKGKLIIFLIILSLTTCKSVDHLGEAPNKNINSSNTAQEMKSRNFLKVGDKNIRLESGSLRNLGVFEDNISDFVLSLFSSDFTLKNGKPVFDDTVISGVIVDLYVDSSSKLVSTRYEKVSYKEIRGNSFQAIDIAIDYNFINEKGIKRRVIKGTLKVSSTGSIYELEFNGTDNKSEKVSFFYEGKLLQIEGAKL